MYLLFEMTYQKTQNIRIGNTEFCGISQEEILMIMKSCDNQMNNSEISVNSKKNHMYVILSLNNAHSASNTDVKFA